MTSFLCHIETLQYRLSKFRDSDLAEINISQQTRDIACQRRYHYKHDKNEYAVMSCKRSDGRDLITPTLSYSPILEQYGTTRSNFKITGHEFGHDLRCIEYDKYEPGSLSRDAFLYSPHYVIWAAALEVTNSFVDKYVHKQTITRRSMLRRLGRCAAVSTGLLTASVGVARYGLNHEEGQADFIADALVPEVTIREAFKDMFRVFKEHRHDTKIGPDKNHTYTRLDLLMNSHPDDEDRYHSSDRNCRYFYKNSKLWTPEF